MLKMLTVLIIFFLSLGLLILISIWLFTCLALILDKIFQKINDLKIEKIESFIIRKHPRLNSRLITGKIKSLWLLDEIYLIPCPVPVKFRINDNAVISSYLIHKKLELIK